MNEGNAHTSTHTHLCMIGSGSCEDIFYKATALCLTAYTDVNLEIPIRDIYGAYAHIHK